MDRMNRDADSTSGDQPPDLWAQLESLIEGLERQLDAGIETKVAIQRALALTAAQLGANTVFLSVSPDGAPLSNDAEAELQAANSGQRELIAAGNGSVDSLLASHREAVWRTEPHGGSWASGSQANGPASQLLWRPVGAATAPLGWLGLAFAESLEPRSAQAVAEIAAVLASMLAERLQRDDNLRLRASAEHQRHLAQWSRSLPQLDRAQLPRTATLLVAERLGADRVWLVEKAGRGRPTLLGVSDASSWDPRSDWVQRILQAVEEDSRVSSASRSSALDSAEHASVVEADVRWSDVSHWLPTERVWLAAESRDSTWYWVIENDPITDLRTRGSYDALLLQLRSLLTAELACRRSAWTRWLTGRRAVTRARGGHWLWFVALMVLVIAGAWPVPLRVVALGELQPKNQRHIFAPDDGRVVQLDVDEGSSVEAGQLVANLVNDELQQRLTETEGQIQTLDAEVSTLRSRLAGINVLDSAQVAEAEQLRSRASLLETRRRGLVRQLTLLKERDARLRIDSPLSGSVITRDLDQRLLERPVRRGQSLLVIADQTGPWVVRAKLEPNDLNPLSQADGAATMRVTSHVDVDREWTASEPRVAGSAIFDEEANAQIEIEAAIDGEVPGHIRPGSQVTVRIDCGRRPLAYVLLRGLIEGGRQHGWW
ncbi:MAG: efflux RND transporter periplasmic adaptor subunit [Planctomycetales bacterium]|nr:efflux RND transporter periplasmic adaptor subunit [Planctomycetales bacterium]